MVNNQTPDRNAQNHDRNGQNADRNGNNKTFEKNEGKENQIEKSAPGKNYDPQKSGGKSDNASNGRPSENSKR